MSRCEHKGRPPKRGDAAHWNPGKSKRWTKKQRSKKERSYRDRRGRVESRKGGGR